MISALLTIIPASMVLLDVSKFMCKGAFNWEFFLKMTSSSHFYTALGMFNILFDRSQFDPFAVDFINLAEKADKNHNDKEDKNKYLIEVNT